MVWRARHPGAEPSRPRASRSPLLARRRRRSRSRPLRAEEPAEAAEAAEEPGPAPLGCRPSPTDGGGRRGRSPRRPRAPDPGRPSSAQMEALARQLLLRRFPLVGPLLLLLRDRALRLRSRRFSGRALLGLALFVAVLHWVHLKTLFENDRHFSHLSSLEREMTFRTEMGLYYSYFKTIIDAPSFLQGLWMIMNDRITEYPLVINAVKRFYLYPEVIIAFWYRTIVGITKFFGITTKTCWNVTRKESLSEIQSCEGLGDPACFYVGVIFIINGSVMGLFFLYGTFLSETQLGGLFTVLCYFFNHGEATRVMWTPPLRESFSYPFLVLQMYILSMILRNSKINKKHFIALCVSNVAFMLPWQFAQFILFTQVASLFSMFVVGYIEPSKFQKIIYISMVSVLLCFVLMFGNPMYLSSYYSSSLLITFVIILQRNKIQKLGSSELSFWLIQGFAWLCGTIFLKFITSKILGVADHIRMSDLIAARILRYSDFDTLLYTCAPEFDFMEKATPVRYTKTLLLPLVMMVAYFICKKTLRDISCVLSSNTYLRKQLLEHGELTFHLLQLVSFTIIAILILRMKLFLTPHMCIVASLLCSQQLFGWLFSKFRFENIIFGILTVMSIQGCANLHNQWTIMGEFSNLPQEELIQWIKYNTRQDAVFAGAMPTMASIKLSTLRPIVNHPHYEDADLRARTKIVYSTYSRKSAKEVRDKLMDLYVNYYVFEEAWCVVRTKPGCSMLEIWDLEDPSNASHPPLCSILLSDAKPYFTTVFQNSVYRVLRVNAP